LAPVRVNVPVPVFATVPAPAMLLARVILDGVVRLMVDPVSGLKLKTGFVTAPRSIVTVAPLAAPRQEPSPQAMPSVGSAVL